jgi:hypothetical protein
LTAYSEEDSFDFSFSQISLIPAVQKDKAMTEARVWSGIGSRLKGSRIRGDKKAILHGHVQDPSLKWDWGFRRGVKLDRSQEEWLITGTYTHFHSKSYASLEKGGELFPLWHRPESPKALELGRSTRSDWRLNVDIADFEVGKIFNLRKLFTLRPHVGMRGTLMVQKFNIDYEKFEKGDLKEPSVRNNCLAVGTRSGVDTSWQLGKGFGVFGDSALSWLSGYHNLNERSLVTSNMGIVVMESSLGLHYEKQFAKSLCFLTIKAGYEFNHFFNQERLATWFSSMTGESTQERISLQGLSWGFRLAF